MGLIHRSIAHVSAREGYKMSAIQRAAIKKPKRQFKPPATELRVGRVPIEKQPTNPNLPPRELSVSRIHTHR